MYKSIHIWSESKILHNYMGFTSLKIAEKGSTGLDYKELTAYRGNVCSIMYNFYY